MVHLSNAETALVGLISEKPKHAYRITSDIKDRSMDYWTDISFSNIYKLLAKLEKRKILTSKIKVTKNNVTQKIYSLTPLGRETFKSKIKELASAWQPWKQPIDIALKNLIFLDKDEAVECLRKYGTSLEETIQGYKDLETYITDNHGHFANIQLATRRIYMLEGEIKWLKDFIRNFTDR
ncbi:MAG: PadR family transcriptional regulator [Spirochaetales bacterium]|nr:PadR family transcriptional regulator [Spirochaetales bacterium]